MFADTEVVLIKRGMLDSVGQARIPRLQFKMIIGCHLPSVGDWGLQ